MLAESPLELKIFIKITHSSDEDSQENGAQDDEKDRDIGHFRPFRTMERKETEAKGDDLIVLQRKKDGKDKESHPE
jgi:hypothetical protein